MARWPIREPLQINPLGNTGGEIVNNAATILLDGPNSNFVDAAGLDALSNFSNNEAAGSFTIQDGRNFTGPSNVNFANAGIVNIGATQHVHNRRDRQLQPERRKHAG